MGKSGETGKAGETDEMGEVGEVGEVSEVGEVCDGVQKALTRLVDHARLCEGYKASQDFILLPDWIYPALLYTSGLVLLFRNHARDGPS